MDRRDNEHWTNPNYKQRMTTKEWKQLLLNKEDELIFRGRLTQLKAKNLGAGIVEISKVQNPN
jgi:hypothetical protein